VNQNIFSINFFFLIRYIVTGHDDSKLTDTQAYVAHNSGDWKV
jgi:hypothetical protein